MKKLKDRADAEIKKKIEIVCKTGGQKSLIKWPMKAEGLLSMWERYSSELDIRINNRINQLTGMGRNWFSNNARRFLAFDLSSDSSYVADIQNSFRVVECYI